MPPKPILAKINEDNRSVTVVSSKCSKLGGIEGTEETEIHAHVHVPKEGGWGWVVVAAAFCIIMTLDGVAYTFGAIRTDMSLDLGESETMVALINSIACAIYLVAGPLDSALLNRFGFRACTMAGALICSLSLFTSYFLTTYIPLCLFFGVFTGFGYSLINISASLIVGFYFDKLRSIALSITMVGGSVGVMAFYPLNVYLCNLVGWRSVTLFHSGLFGCAYFLAMTFRPLLEVRVTPEDSTRTVTYLPSLSAVSVKTTTSQQLRPESKSTVTERMFSAVKNDNFPTAAAVVDLDIKTTVLPNEPGPSAGNADKTVSKLTITAITPKSGLSPAHLQQVKSITSKSGYIPSKQIDITIPEQEPKRVSWWGRFCCWEKHLHRSRPMYRDDAFYDGNIEQLPEYQKSKAGITAEQETGLEYRLAVSRAAAAHDLEDHRGVCTPAFRRVLATMMDPQLLKRRSFQFMCASTFFLGLGNLVPYAYIQDRNLLAGMDNTHCSLFVSAIGGSNAIGRLLLGALAQKYSPLSLYVASVCGAGLSAIISNLSFDLYFQYSLCCIFGFGISSMVCLRAVILVQLYGLERLTNATGMLLLWNGVATLISTPLASAIKDEFGYTIVFILAGAFITLGGLVVTPLNYLCKKENASTTPPTAPDVIPKKPTKPKQKKK